MGSNYGYPQNYIFMALNEYIVSVTNRLHIIFNFQLENKELRKLLSISKESVEVRQELLDVATQATKPQSWNS